VSDRPFLLFLKKGRSISSTQRRHDRPFGYECFCREERSPFMYTRCQRSDRTFGIERSIALYCFFTGGGRSLFLTSKGRSPFTTFSRATGDRTFSIQKSIALDDFFTREGRSLFLHPKVDRPLRLFHGRRAINSPSCPPLLKGG